MSHAYMKREPRVQSAAIRRTRASRLDTPPRAPRTSGRRTDLTIAAQAIPTIMDTTMYNTIPAADEPLVQTKAAPTSSKTLIFAAAATTLVLGAACATFVAPKSTIGTYIAQSRRLREDAVNGTNHNFTGLEKTPKEEITCSCTCTKCYWWGYFCRCKHIGIQGLVTDCAVVPKGCQKEDEWAV